MISPEKSLNEHTATITSCVRRGRGREESVSQDCYVTLFKISSFQQKIVRRAKKQDVMVPPWGGEGGQLIETSPEEAQTLDFTEQRL